MLGVSVLNKTLSIIDLLAPLSLNYNYTGVSVQYTYTECTRILVAIMYIMLRNKMTLSIRDALLVVIILSDVIMLIVPSKTIVLN
jgi:hypothetical protein